MYELVYTSSPRGLLAGRSGFSTVAMTAGFPPNLISPIENMSGYRNLFPPGHPDADRNPVNYSCQHYRWGSTLFIVLSKISYAGLSFTGRTNVLAHHLLFTPDELASIPGGATAVLRCPENFPPWSGAPRELPRKSPKRIGRAPAASPELWTELAGDKNWAAYAAERFRTDPKHGWVFAFDPVKISGEMLLELIDSVTNRLSPEEAMNFTFCTYCTSPAITSSLALRGYPEGSPQLAGVEHLTPENIIRLGRYNPIPGGWQPPPPPDATEPSEPPAEPLPPPVPETPQQPEEPKLYAPAPVRLKPSAPPRVQAYVPGGTNLAPCIPRQDAPMREEEVREKRFSPRAIFFAVPILLLGGLLLAYLLQPSPGRKGTTQVPAAAKKPLRTVPPKKAAGYPAAQSEVPKKAAPSSAAQSTPPPEDPEESLRQLFLFHREFNLGKAAPLPAPFRKSPALTVALNGIGASNDIADLNGCISVSGRKITVYPFKKTEGDLDPVKSADKSSPHVMTLELTDDCLIVKVPQKAQDRPRIGNIGRITIIGPGGKRLVFTPNAPDRRFIGPIRKNPGTVTVKPAGVGEKAIYDCALEVSDNLWAFRRHLVLRVNGKDVSGDIDSPSIVLPELNFTDEQELLSRWNAAVAECQNARRELAKCKPEDKSFMQNFRALMSQVPEEAKTQRRELEKAIERGKISISEEIAALCAKLPRYKKSESDVPTDSPLKKQLGELEGKWKTRLRRKKKEKALSQCTAVLRRRRTETVSRLQKLPRELFGDCLKKVKSDQRVAPDFYTHFSRKSLRNTIKIEPDWREDHGSASTDR